MRTFAFHMLVLSLAAASASCVDNDASSFYIDCNIIPESEDRGCSLDPGGRCLTRGLYNPSTGAGYQLFPRYNNQLRARGSDAPLRADPNGVHVQGAEIELMAADGSTMTFGGLPNPFSVPTSTFVPSAQGPDAAGQSVGSIMLIPPNYGSALTGAGVSTIVAAVRVFGETNGDVDVESDDFLWPIDLCSGGCLLLCPSPDMMAEEEPCCAFGQDFACAVQETDPLCGAACGAMAGSICL